MLVACCAAPLSVVRKTNTASPNPGESRCAAELTSAVGTNRIQADNAKQVRADRLTHCFAQQTFLRSQSLSDFASARMGLCSQRLLRCKRRTGCGCSSFTCRQPGLHAAAT